MIPHVLETAAASFAWFLGWAAFIAILWFAWRVVTGRYERDRPTFGAVDLRDWLAHCAPQLDGYGPWRRGDHYDGDRPAGFAVMSGVVEIPGPERPTRATFEFIAAPLRVDIERGNTWGCSHPALQRAVRELRAVR